jgi:geranylgeranyl reductase family protein
MPPASRYDVVIVGAGPAGTSLAIALRKAGVRVLLLERFRFPRDKVCGDFVSPRGLSFLEELGCLEEVLEQGATQIRSAFVHYDGQRLTGASIPHVAGLPDFGLAVPRMILDHVLFRRATALGADSVEGARVTGFSHERGGVRVHAEVDGARRTFPARLVVAADGAQSVIARAAGVEEPGAGSILPTLRAYCSGLDFSYGHFFFDQDVFPGFGWIFPIDSNLSNVGVGAPKELVTRGDANLHAVFARLKARLIAQGRAVGTTPSFSKERGFPIRVYRGRGRYSFDRGILVGEAARLVDPISGEGIALALESGVIAGRVLPELLERDALGEASLAAYDAMIVERFCLELDVTDLVVSAVRQRALKRLWLWSFRWMSTTASRDPSYAEQIGGIFAGLIPNWRALSPELLLKPLLHLPAFAWGELAGLGDSPLARLSSAAEAALALDSEVWRAYQADPGSFTSWAREIAGKHGRIMGHLARARAAT